MLEDGKIIAFRTKIMSDTMIKIGQIPAPQGVRGEVRVIKPLTGVSERFKNLKVARLDDGTTLCGKCSLSPTICISKAFWT